MSEPETAPPMPDDLRYRIAGLHLRSGDVLVIKNQERPIESEYASRIRDGLLGMGLRNRVLFLNPETDLSVMTGEELEKRIGPPMVSITSIMLAMFGCIDQEHRLQIFMELSHLYCRHCGCEQPAHGRGCQCWNDE